MKVLVVGSGGREHALVWKIAQSPLVKKIYCAPGNAGTGELAENLNIDSDNVEKLLQFAMDNKVDLTVVGPENPLVAGIVDQFESRGLKIFGPIKSGALIEGSKVFSKEIMKKYAIPTADYGEFNNLEEAIDYIGRIKSPMVIKADGLAAGKGVLICHTKEEAAAAVNTIMKEKVFGSAGSRIIIEEYLKGEEASIIALTDSKTIVPLASSQDHKRVDDNDQGLNTGGMGAYSPAPVVDQKMMEEIENKVLKPFLFAMEKEGIKYKGVIYAGIMATRQGIKVLEFNCRFGDPETQPIMMRMKSDLVPIINAVIDEKLKDVAIEWDPRAAVCVVLASGGYPGIYGKNMPIFGLENTHELKEACIFHAGTKTDGGRTLTAGGRVLGVTALGSGIKEAINNAYEAVKLVNFRNMHYRKDIGRKAMAHLK
jgi:phosphoribosylamine---glycine ligase